MTPVRGVSRDNASREGDDPSLEAVPDGWTREYNGYLTTESYNHKRTTFECMYEAPEIIEGSAASTHTGPYSTRSRRRVVTHHSLALIMFTDGHSRVSSVLSDSISGTPENKQC